MLHKWAIMLSLMSTKFIWQQAAHDVRTHGQVDFACKALATPSIPEKAACTPPPSPPSCMQDDMLGVHHANLAMRLCRIAIQCPLVELQHASSASLHSFHGAHQSEFATAVQ